MADTSKSKMFLNLPVANLQKSMAFYKALGFTFNPQFTDDTAACMVVSEHNFVMLLTHDKFKGFSNAPIPDAKNSTGLMVALDLASREDVDAMMAASAVNGGGEPRPAIDMGFMYNRTFSDPDGHRWEPFFMDMSKMPKG